LIYLLYIDDCTYLVYAVAEKSSMGIVEQIEDA